MSAFHLEHLGRDAYIASIAAITDPKSSRFADMSLKWWDRHFSWQVQGCVVLADSRNEHLCYIFYKIDRYCEYMTIHNLFTPLSMRRNGYAQELLKMVFDLALIQHVRRFKLSCISRSLDFYLALGFVYWGVTNIGDYYCDLPMPAEGLDGLAAMIERSDTRFLLGNKFDAIYAKVEQNGVDLTSMQETTISDDKIKMQRHFMRTALQTHKER